MFQNRMNAMLFFCENQMRWRNSITSWHNWPALYLHCFYFFMFCHTKGITFCLQIAENVQTSRKVCGHPTMTIFTNWMHKVEIKLQLRAIIAEKERNTKHHPFQLNHFTCLFLDSLSLENKNKTMKVISLKSSHHCISSLCYFGLYSTSVLVFGSWGHSLSQVLGWCHCQWKVIVDPYF